MLIKTLIIIIKNHPIIEKNFEQENFHLFDKPSMLEKLWEIIDA